MDKQLQLLIGTVPDWTTLWSKADALRLDASIPRRNGGSWPSLRLEVSTIKGKLQARESPPSLWPTFCPQRHINVGGYFCLGLSDVPQVVDDDTATAWWETLRAHLEIQFAADRTKRWPTHLEWDHGKAGDIQVEMERLAAEHGLLDDVRGAHINRIGWLSGELPRIDSSGTRLVNGRSPCPRGCIKGRHAIVRRNCPKRAEILKLVKLEIAKRKASAEFWEAASDQLCCGLMSNCPLQSEVECGE